MMNIFVGGICGGVGCLVGMWYKHSVEEKLTKENEELREELAQYKNSEYDITQIAYMKRENERLSTLERALKEKVEELGRELRDTREQLVFTHQKLCGAYHDVEMLWERVMPDVEGSV